MMSASSESRRARAAALAPPATPPTMTKRFLSIIKPTFKFLINQKDFEFMPQHPEQQSGLPVRV
jgi:hypothetical protein